MAVYVYIIWCVCYAWECVSQLVCLWLVSWPYILVCHRDRVKRVIFLEVPTSNGCTMPRAAHLWLNAGWMYKAGSAVEEAA